MPPDPAPTQDLVRAATAEWAQLADANGGRAARVSSVVCTGHLLLALLQRGTFDVVPLLADLGADLVRLRAHLETEVLRHRETTPPAPEGFDPAKVAIARFAELVRSAERAGMTPLLAGQIDDVKEFMRGTVRELARADDGHGHQADVYRWVATRLHADLDQLEAAIRDSR